MDTLIVQCYIVTMAMDGPGMGDIPQAMLEDIMNSHHQHTTHPRMDINGILIPYRWRVIVTMCVAIRSRSHGNSSQYRAIKTTTDNIGATKISKYGAH